MPTRDGTSDPTESAEGTAEAVKAVVAEAEAIAASPAVADDAEQWCEGGDVLGSPLELPAAAGGRASGMPRLSFFLRTPPSGQSAIPLDRRRVSTFFKAPEQEDEVSKWLQSTTPVAPRAFGAGGGEGLGAISETGDPAGSAPAAVAKAPSNDGTTRTLQFELKPRAFKPTTATNGALPASRLAKPPPASSISSRLPKSSLKRPSMLARPCGSTKVPAPPKPKSAVPVPATRPSALKPRSVDSRV